MQYLSNLNKTKNSQLELPSLIKEGVRLSKNKSLWGRGGGVLNFILFFLMQKYARGGDAAFLLLFSSITFTVSVKKLKFSLLLLILWSFVLVMQDSHLIYSGSVKKTLTALFKLIWNTQKSTWTNFLAYQGKTFLSIGKILMKVSEEQPYCFSLHF